MATSRTTAIKDRIRLGIQALDYAIQTCPNDKVIFLCLSGISSAFRVAFEVIKTFLVIIMLTYDVRLHLYEIVSYLITCTYTHMTLRLLSISLNAMLIFSIAS